MVAVVADSAANLPGDMARELGIEVVPMYLNFGDRVYRDGIDLSPQGFYHRLRRDRTLASTSAPSPGDFLEAYRRTGQDEIVCVTVAARLSATHHQARLAAESFEGRVEVVDSGSASMGEGFAALEAARRSASGASADEVADRAREVAERALLLAAIDTFDFLQKSGRVTGLQAFAATTLGVKPVFSFRRGEPRPVARVRTRKRAIERIVQDSLEEIGNRPVHLAVIHADAEMEALSIARGIAGRADVVESLTAEATPVIGAHTGPGLVGAAFYCD